MLGLHCLRTLRTFSADDTSFWNNGIQFISNIDIIMCFVIEQRPINCCCCCEFFTGISYSLDSLHKHSILYYFTNVYSFKSDAFGNLQLLLCNKYGMSYTAFKIHSSNCHCLSKMLASLNHEHSHDFGPTKHACITDQESDEIQCECNTNFCWKLKYTNFRTSFFRSCTHKFLIYVLLFTPCNDLFVLKKNRYRKSALNFSVIPITV